MLTVLRYQRLLRGWKATEVARRLTISASYYSRIESGKLKPAAGLRRRIARLFRASQRALFKRRPKRLSRP